MANKMAAAYQFVSARCCGHSNLVILFRVLPIFINGLLVSHSGKFEYEFCPANDSQDGRQNGCRQSVCTHVHPTLVIYYLITSEFHVWVTFIKLSPKFKYGLFQLTKMASKMASLHLWTLLLSHLSPDFFQISYLLLLSYTGPTSNMDFFR